MSGRNDPKKILRRAQIVITIILLLSGTTLIALMGRVVYLQRNVAPELAQKVTKQNTAAREVMAAPGMIRAADGTPFAVSVRMYNLFADPGYILDPEGKLSALKGEDIEKAKKLLFDALSPLVERPAEDLAFQLESNATYADGKPRRFLWLAKEVNEDFYEKFLALRKQMKDEARSLRSKDKSRSLVMQHALDGVNFVRSVKRVYPMGSTAGSVIGFRNNYEGVDGLEHQLEDLLKARPGRMLVTKDASSRTLLIQDGTYKPADNGRSVWLTIDPVIQNIAEEELNKACNQYRSEGGVAIVMDPFNGRILAMANWPFFDPSHYQTSDPTTRRNKAVVDPYEPGSIFKPFVLSWALENKVVTANTLFDCHFGRWNDPTGRLVTDTHGYGTMSAEDILIKSSNIGMAQIGWKMGIPMVYEAVKTFGFGDRTGCELPGDQKGLIKPLSQWNKGTLTSASFGYEVAATPLQLLRGYCTFANGGWLVTPRIIHAVEEEPGKVVSWQDVAGPPMEKQILSPGTVKTMQKIMEGVYLTGTARSSASRMYRLFGKTGTAHLAIQGAGHYASNEYNGSFLCGGPASQPRLVVCVTLHKPDRSLGHFGGTVAAPAASVIIERALSYMQVAPDQTDKKLAAN